MEELYERTVLVITAFDAEDVITTSGSKTEDKISVIDAPEGPPSSWW